MSWPSFKNALQAGIAVGRALRAADYLPDASPCVRFTLETAAGDWCYEGHLSLLGAARITSVLEAAEVVQHRQPTAPSTRPRLHVVPTP